MKVPLLPLNDKILVSPIAPEVVVNGIAIPDIAKKRPDRGKVVAVGEGKILENGTRVPSSLKKGDIVLFNCLIGEDVEEGGKKYKILRENEILAKLEA